MEHSEQQVESLRANEESLRFLIGRVKEYAIFMLDPAGKVLVWNSGAELILGYSSVEATGGSKRYKSFQSQMIFLDLDLVERDGLPRKGLKQ